jgi:hypothetical protein
MARYGLKTLSLLPIIILQTYHRHRHRIPREPSTHADNASADTGRSIKTYRWQEM